MHFNSLDTAKFLSEYSFFDEKKGSLVLPVHIQAAIIMFANKR